MRAIKGLSGASVSALEVSLQMDEVLKGLGPKENRSAMSGARLTPSARLVGEGVSLLPSL